MLVISEEIGVRIMTVLLVSLPQDLCFFCLPSLTDVNCPGTAFSSNSCCQSFTVFSHCLSGVVGYLSVMNTIKITQPFHILFVTTAKPWVKAQSCRRLRALTWSLNDLPVVGVSVTVVCCGREDSLFYSS
jgi:hypothetical protein